MRPTDPPNTKETSLLGSFFQILSSRPWDAAWCPVGAQLLNCVLLLLNGEGGFRIRPGCRCKSAVAANFCPESWTFQDWFPRPHVGQRGRPHRDAGLVTSDLRPQGPALSTSQLGPLTPGTGLQVAGLSGHLNSRATLCRLP